MKPCFTVLTAALLALLLGSGLHTTPGNANLATAAQGPNVRITDADSLAQYLKSIGVNAKLVKVDKAYCLIAHESAGSKTTIKALAYPDEPAIELYVELKVPANVSANSLLKILQISRNWFVYHRPDDNKMVVQFNVFSKDLGSLPKYLDRIHQGAVQIHQALNASTGTIE